MVLGMNLLSKFSPITFFVIYWCPLLPCYVSESSNFPLFTLAGCEFLFPSNLVRIYYVFIWHVRKEFLFLWRHACSRVDIWMEMNQIPYSMPSWRKNKISHESATMGQPLTNLPTSPWVYCIWDIWVCMYKLLDLAILLAYVTRETNFLWARKNKGPSFIQEGEGWSSYLLWLDCPCYKFTKPPAYIVHFMDWEKHSQVLRKKQMIKRQLFLLWKVINLRSMI